MQSAESHPEHYVKSVQIRSYFWFVFSCIRTEYGDLRSTGIKDTGKYEYRKIRTRNNSAFGHFSRSGIYIDKRPKWSSQ